KDETRRAVALLGEAARLLDAAVREGSFVPRTKSASGGLHCAACDFNVVCGPGHQRVFERKRRSLLPGHPLLTLEEIP
ncbi:MAG TPA: hypothetical protein VGR00_04700, partial [Thermoanaerobaculia bacterium]|nr:hypothetical protein [Thermoanaerobaculia bacterium]